MPSSLQYMQKALAVCFIWRMILHTLSHIGKQKHTAVRSDIIKYSLVSNQASSKADDFIQLTKGVWKNSIEFFRISLFIPVVYKWLKSCAKKAHFPYPIEILFLNLCGSSVSHLFFWYLYRLWPIATSKTSSWEVWNIKSADRQTSTGCVVTPQRWRTSRNIY